MFFTSSIKQLDAYINLYDEIITLLQQGLSILQVVSILKDNYHNTVFKKQLVLIEESLVSGGSFFSNMHYLFPKQITVNVNFNSNSPNTIVFLEDFKTLFLNQKIFLERFEKCLRYPFILCCLTLVLLGVLLFIMVPQFNHLIRSMGVDVPTYLAYLLEISSFVRQHCWYLIVLCTILFFIIKNSSMNRFSLFSFFNFKTDLIYYFSLLSIFLKNGFSLSDSFLMIRSSKHHNLNKTIDRILSTGDIVGNLVSYFHLNRFYKARLLFALNHGNLAETFSYISLKETQRILTNLDNKLFWVQPILLSIMGTIILGFITIVFIPILATF